MEPIIVPAQAGENKNKKLTIATIAIVVVILAIIAGIFLYLNYSKKPAVVLPASKNEVAQDVSEIVDSGEFAACDSVQDIGYKAVCKNNVARKLANDEKDPEWCKKLDGKSMNISECILSIVSMKAYTQNDIKICDELEKYQMSASKEDCQDSFYLDSAQNKNEKVLCDSIKRESTRTFCIGIFNPPSQIQLKGIND